MRKYEGIMKKYEVNIKEFPNVTSSGGRGEGVLTNLRFTPGVQGWRFF